MEKQFISAATYNEVVEITKTNCLAFSLGLTEPNGRYELQSRNCDGDVIDICTSFQKMCMYHNIKVRKVHNFSDTIGKTSFLVYGWYLAFPNYDFHVIRKNPDGSFEEKPDWKSPCRVIPSSEFSLGSFNGPLEYPEGPEGLFVLE